MPEIRIAGLSAQPSYLNPGLLEEVLGHLVGVAGKNNDFLYAGVNQHLGADNTGVVCAI